MSLGSRPAERPRVRALTRGASLGARLHCVVRAATCPLERVVESAMGAATVLEVGCGHGLLSGLLALAPSRPHVVGIDIDASKMADAGTIGANVRAAGGDLTIEHSDGAALPGGPWDAVVLADVLYLLEPAEQAALVSASAAVLARRGRLIVKEMADTPRWKARWNRGQETLAVRVLGLTEGATVNPPPPGAVQQWMEMAGLAHRGERIDRHYVHPHYLHVGTAP